MPGVIAAYSGRDLADVQGALPCAWPVTPDMVHPDHYPLAVDEVRYVGDGVAVVIARDRYAAADALEAIAVEYEQLPAVVDMEAALAEGSPLVHSDKGTNACFTWPFAGGADYAETVAAHPDAVVVKRRFKQQRLLPTPMEPRSVVVAPIAAADEYTVYSATQIPHILRVMLALVTGIGEHKIRVIAPDVGGGFGCKLNVYAEEVLALVVARKLGRPIKWTESRSEHYQATIHGRDQIQDIEIASTPDGTLLGLKVELLADMGAYLQLVTPGVPILGAFMFPAIYKMDAYSFSCTGVFTTKTPTDAYRGAGRPEATFAIERIMDELAAELGRDPMDLRKQNWIKHEEFPYEMVAGLTYDSGNYEAATELAEQMFDMDGAAGRAGRAAGAPGPGPARHRHLDLHRDVRPGAVAGARLAVVRRRWLGGGLDPDAAHRQGRGDQRCDAARPGPPHRLEPDRRGRPRRAVRGRRGHHRRHRLDAARAWTPTGRGRWSSAAWRSTRPPAR